MAFVMGQAPQRMTLQIADTPGPGNYEQVKRFTTEQAAPFNSSSMKKSLFNCVPDTSTIYNPQLPSRTHYVTSSFISRVQRFPSPKLQNVQPPLCYQQLPKNQCPERKQQPKAHKKRQSCGKRNVIVANSTKDCVRIVLANPNNSEMLQSIYVNSTIVQPQHGPGSYNINRKKSLNGVNWSRSGPRYPHSRLQQGPGPGSYQVPIKPTSRTLSASFSYGGARSYLDEIIFKTKVPLKMAIMKQYNLKSQSPGPGDYKCDSPEKSFYKGPQQFGVKLGRQERKQKTTPGPGFYNLNAHKLKRVINAAAEVRQKIFGKKASKKKKQITTLEEGNKEEILRLSQYKQKTRKFYSLKERCSSKTGTLGRSDRFVYKRNAEPGPGQYKFIKRITEKCLGSVFASKSQRIGKAIVGQNNKIPFYETTNNDISTKAFKVRANIEQLRLINCIRPPFNCGSPRLQTQTSIVQAQPLSLQKQVVVETIKKPKATAAFKSNTRRLNIQKDQFVGPGSYNANLEKWEKKSFNKQYREKLQQIKQNSMRLHSL